MGSYNSFLDYYDGKINRDLFNFGLQFKNLNFCEYSAREKFFNEIILQEYYSCNFNSQKLSSYFQLLFDRKIKKKELNFFRIKRVDLCYLNYSNIFIKELEEFYSQFMIGSKAFDKSYYIATKKQFFLIPILNENQKRNLFS